MDMLVSVTVPCAMLQVPSDTEYGANGAYDIIYNSSVHKSVLTEQYIEHIS